MGVGDLLPENRHGMIAAHIVFAEMHAPRRIDPDRQFAAIAIAGMRLARELRRTCEVPLGSFGHFTHGLAADDPSIGIEGVVNLFVVCAQDSGRDARRSRRKAAGMKAAVDGGAHVADDVGSHAGYSPCDLYKHVLYKRPLRQRDTRQAAERGDELVLESGIHRFTGWLLLPELMPIEATDHCRRVFADRE